MAYTDINTPVIEQITLPSGNSYYIADREIRDVVDTLSQTVAGGVSYTVAWDGTSAPTVANIPAGVTVTYNDTSYTGTLAANNATPGAFYLVKSSTQVDGKDVYDEYVPVGATGSKTWEKIGDTQIALTDVVTGVSLSKQTDTVIGTDATFTITQPTVKLETGATAGTGVVSVATGISNVTQPTVALSEESSTATGRVAYTKSVSTTKLSATASGGDADWGTKDTKTVLTGVQVTSQPSVTLTANTSTATGRVAYLESQGSATTTKLSASASGGGVAWNSKDQKTALTGVKVTAQPTVTLTANAETDTGRITYIESASASNTNVKATASGANTAWNSKDQKTVITSYPGTTGSAASSVAPTTKKLATTTITGVSGSTNITPVESRSSQTTADGTWTAVASGATGANNNLLANVSVSNGVLTIGAATLDTQTTYSAGAPRSSLAVPTAASSATRVATGSVNTTDTNGASVVTNVDVGDTVTVLTGLGTPTTANVIGSSSTFTVTQPTVALSTGATAGAGVVSLTNDISPTTKYMSAAASGTAVGANGTANVIGASSTFTHTNPTVTIASGTTGDVTVATGIGAGTTKYLSASATGTAVGANGTASVIGSDATISHTDPTITLATGSTGDVTIATGGTTKYMAATASGTAVTPSTTNIKATATGANTAWNNKDSVTVLKSTTDVSVTKGSV